MVIRQRAIHSEDKHERHHAILDATERLLLRAPVRVANMAEVADEAGLAKGTVYLYFPSKEELLLAVHERHADGFFGALVARLARSEPITLDEMMQLTQTHFIDPPTFLPLATRCFGILETEVPRQVAVAFKERMAERLQAASVGLERHFPELRPGGGVALLRHSYALIVGLWQMTANQNELVAGTCNIDAIDYPSELQRALGALWDGTIGRRLAARWETAPPGSKR
jgi:AcrR family transcriptional regulator